MRHWPRWVRRTSVLLAAGDLATTSRRGANGYQAYGGAAAASAWDRYPRAWAGSGTCPAQRGQVARAGALCDHPAVLPDTQLRAVAERLGVTAATPAGGQRQLDLLDCPASAVRAGQPRKPGISPSCEGAQIALTSACSAG